MNQNNNNLSENVSDDSVGSFESYYDIESEDEYVATDKNNEINDQGLDETQKKILDEAKRDGAADVTKILESNGSKGPKKKKKKRRKKQKKPSSNKNSKNKVVPG